MGKGPLLIECKLWPLPCPLCQLTYISRAWAGTSQLPARVPFQQALQTRSVSAPNTPAPFRDSLMTDKQQPPDPPSSSKVPGDFGGLSPILEPSQQSSALPPLSSLETLRVGLQLSPSPLGPSSQHSSASTSQSLPALRQQGLLPTTCINWLSQEKSGALQRLRVQGQKGPFAHVLTPAQHRPVRPAQLPLCWARQLPELASVRPAPSWGQSRTQLPI